MTRALPEDPLIRGLVQQARAAQLTRRGVLAGAGGLAAALALAACGTGRSPAPTAPPDGSATDRRLTWVNWPQYLDEDDAGGHPTLARFTEQTGIAVEYRPDIEDNNSYYSEVKARLALGSDIDADAVCLTDWMVSRLIRFGYTQELDHSAMPNLANLLPDLRNVDFDPGRAHSVPWQGGFAGICWNTELVPDGIRTIDDLWSPDLAGRVGVLSEMRDTIGLIMLQEGIDISSDFGDSDFGVGLDIFRDQVASGQIGSVRGNSYLDDLANEDTLVAICWSGDITTLNAKYGDRWEFAIPEAGGVLWTDNFVVPIGSPRKRNVETLIDYYYDPVVAAEVAAEVAAWVNYIVPVVGAQEAMLEIDPALAEDPLIFPDDEMLANVKSFRTLSGAEEQSYISGFQSVLLGS